MDFSTDNWTFSLGDDKPEPSLGTDEAVLPYISTPEAWSQYNNEVIYEADCLMRKWLAVMAQNKKWCRTQSMRKYTFSILFEQIKGRKYDVKKDASITNAYARVFSWYSSRIQKTGTVDGKWRSKPVYVISSKRLEKPPYSLKLRLEWFAEQGMVPTSRNMALPKDLKQGHARNPQTEANMERRREIGREIYNKRYHDRNRSGKAGISDS